MSFDLRMNSNENATTCDNIVNPDFHECEIPSKLHRAQDIGFLVTDLALTFNLQMSRPLIIFLSLLLTGSCLPAGDSRGQGSKSKSFPPPSLCSGPLESIREPLILINSRAAAQRGGCKERSRRRGGRIRKAGEPFSDVHFNA